MPCVLDTVVRGQTRVPALTKPNRFHNVLDCSRLEQKLSMELVISDLIIVVQFFALRIESNRWFDDCDCFIVTEFVLVQRFPLIVSNLF